MNDNEDAEELTAGFVQTIKRVSIKLGALKSSFKDLDLKVGKLEKTRKNLVSEVGGFDFEREIRRMLESKQEFKTKEDIFERLSSLLKRVPGKKAEKGQTYSVLVLPGDNEPGKKEEIEEKGLPVFGSSKEEYKFPGRIAPAEEKEKRKGKIELKIETIHHPDRPGQSSMNITGLEHFVNGPNNGTTQNSGTNGKKGKDTKLELTVQQISNYYHHPPDFIQSQKQGGNSDREIHEKNPPPSKNDRDNPPRILKARVGSIDKRLQEDPTGSKASNMEALQNNYLKKKTPNKVLLDRQSDSKSIIHEDKFNSDRDKPPKNK